MSELAYRDRFYENKAVQTEAVLGKKLPASVEAEKAVLAAILLNDENLTLVTDILKS